MHVKDVRMYTFTDNSFDERDAQLLYRGGHAEHTPTLEQYIWWDFNET